MDAITEEDLDNLATLIAIHDNKALSYRNACWNRAQARRQESLTDTLRRVYAACGGKETKEAGK